MKQRLGFQPADDGDAVLVEMWVEPGGGVPPHVHPSMEERFEVISGELSFLAGRKWQTAGAGETVVVPAGHAPRLPQQRRRAGARRLPREPAPEPAGVPRGGGRDGPRRAS